MIIIEILGGLGNQMFQYALGRCLAKKNNAGLKLDISGYGKNNLRQYELEVFNIKENFASPQDTEKLKYKRDNPVESLVKQIKGKKHKKLS